MPAIHVNDETFATEVLETTKPVLVDFWAPWCGPCRAMSSVVDDIADELSEDVTVVKANVDESSAAATRYGIQSIPAFLVLKQGKVLETLTGVVSKERLLALLDHKP